MTASIAPTRTTASVRPWLQPLLVAALVCLVSGVVLVVLVRGVLAVGVGIELLAIALLVATALLAVGLGLLFRVVGARSHWLAASVLAVSVLGVYVALLVTGTQRVSILTLGPELEIVIVSLAAGAASAILLPGRWRVLGLVGILGLVALALTPVLVAL